MMTVFLCAVASAQTRTVHGQVLYAGDDEPLVGATVMPVGGGQGVATDIDGKFSLKLSTNVKRLRVSYIGMITETVDITDGEMIIKLNNADTKLDEVMVVAYGTATKEAFTGSAAVINSEQIEKSQATNALNALTGKVAGVQLTNANGEPGQTTPTIRIRGISSLNAGNSPLVIVDGAPFPGDINTINPSDIASMTLLKDAASNALYGARGANGVIIITTKKGQLGSGATVTLDAKWGQNSNAQQRYNTINDPRQYYEVYYQSLYNYAAANGLSPEAAYKWANTNLTADNSYGLAYQTFSVPDGQYLIGTDGKFNPNATPGNIVNYKGTEYYLQPDDWYDQAYHNSLRQEYNFSVTNGTEQTQFYLSAGYLKNEGITPASNYERFTGRLSADTQAKSWLKVGANMSYTHYNALSMNENGASNSSGNVFAAATQVAPIYPLFMRNPDGSIMYDENGIIRYDYGDGANAGLQRPVYGKTNALSDAVLNTNKYNGNAFNATGYAEIRFLKDFKFTTKNTVNYDGSRYSYVTNPYYGTYASSNGIVSKQTYETLTYTLQQLLDYNHTFGGVHEVSVLAGHEFYKDIATSLSADRNNMFDPNNDELADAVSAGESDSYKTIYNNEGWLFRAQYNYNQKYFASASFRRDASSRFHPDHRWGNFWSAGGAWIMSKEEWFNLPWVDLFKVKASYGEQGNDNISNFLYTNTYNIVNGSGNVAATPATMGNPNISWEKNGNFNAGIEFELFNSRLDGSIEGFWRKTSDMLSWFPLPPSFGYTGYWDNIGDMKNAGIEIDLQGIIFQSRNFTWTANANLTYYKNTLAYLPEARKTMTVDGVNGYQSGSYFYGEGIPLYTFHLHRYAGVDHETGDPLYYHRVLDDNGDPTGALEAVTYDKLSSEDYFLCGSALPKVYGGFGTTFNAYGFDLSLDFSYSLGGQVYDGDYALYMGTPTTNGGRGQAIHADILKAWTPQNPNSDIPRYQFGDLYTTSPSDRFLISANYLSLQNINFGYTLPLNIVRKMQLSNLRVYLACDNVWVWSKRQGLDPRQSISGSVNNTYYAPIRTISGGLSVTF